MTIFDTNKNLEVIQKIAKKKRVSLFLVGGYLRDYVLGRDNIDFDFAVSKNALKLAEEVAKSIKGVYVLLDEEHGCARVVRKEKGVIYTFDFANFRAPTIQGDLRHRDFTINTLAIDMSKVKHDSTWDSLLKIGKKASEDLSKKKVRMTRASVFKEDPLRLLRGFSMSATLGFKIDEATKECIKENAPLLKSVASERIGVEWFKILTSPRAYKTLVLMDRLGVLEQIIPQVRIMFGCTQGKYHHLNVWKHSLEAVNQFEKICEEVKEDDKVNAYFDAEIVSGRSRRSIIKMAVLLHDIGKPDTRKKRPEGGYSFYSHEHVGKRITHHIARQLKVSTKERRMLEDMVQFHLRPGYISNYRRPSAKMIYRYMRDTKDEAVSVALLSLADQRATRGPLTSESDQVHHEDICRMLVEQFFVKREEKPLTCFITGRDLIKSLKLKPSKLFSVILKEVEEQQVLGKITSKKEALSLAKDIKKQETNRADK
ncbi:MAG: poly(A) polymerase [Candidatus Omnitrophota bacterium]|jgi:poly(A) polymerase